MTLRFCAILVLIATLQSAFAYQYSYRFSSLNISSGLSNNQVNCIYKDAKGFMWFGTMSGLNRYDGYSVKVFRHKVADSLSLLDDYITAISAAPGNKMFVQTRNGNNLFDPVTEKFLDAQPWLAQNGIPVFGNLTVLRTGNIFWFAHVDSGLYRMDANGKTTRIKTRPGNITDIKADSKNQPVLVYNNGLIEKLNAETGQPVASYTAVNRLLAARQGSFFLYNDAQDDIWVYAAGLGAIYFNPVTNTTREFSQKNGVLNNDVVRSITQDNNGLVWIGTDHGGINIINKKNFSSGFVTHKDDDKTSLAENAVYSLYKDDMGIIWVGTFKKGVSYFAENMAKFNLFRSKQSDVGGLNYDDINRFAEDKKGNLWIGTNGGGLIYFNRADNSFTQYRHQPGNPNSISSDVVVSLYIDKSEKLWIGYFFGGLDCFENGRITNYRHNDTDPSSLADNSVWEIYEDNQANLWVGTLGGGLDRFDREKKIFYHNKVGLRNSVHSNFISAFEEDKNGNLWIGTAYGIDLLDKSKGIFIQMLSATHKLSNDNVNALLRDSKGRMWAGTREGLSLFDEQTQTFKSFRMEDGLPDNTIFTILEDNNQHLWVSTSNGISKITVTENKNGITINCRNFDEADGLQGNVFNDNAGFKTRAGELAFGGANGFNLFNPADIKRNNNVPTIVFTGLQVFNKPVSVNEKTGNHIILKESVSETKEIALRYNQNDFSIDFAALNFLNTDKNKYAYRLEGFNKEWLLTDGKTRRATYTNLDPGSYTLHVKASNEDGVWNDKGIALKITILPPFWKTPLAYVLYIIIIAAALLFARHITIRRAHARFALAQERREAQRLHELDMMKIKFFTNVSHEFRTPLALILTPLDKIIKNAAGPDEKKQFQLIHRNARRLLNLVNQLLDFRKMEVQELKLNPMPGNLVKFIKDVSYSFTDLAEKKNISFSYNSNTDELHTRFDHDKIERILFNLLSNAFKFTPENGAVSVEVSAGIKDGEALMEIKVRDTGIGIPAEKLDKIFDRFFQSEIPGTLVNQGSGIGLAITREFVKMHDGIINVESEVDNGSCFTVLLPFKPVSEVSDMADTPLLTEEDEAGLQVIPSAAASEDAKAGSHRKPTLLLVEDNEDFRFYLKDNLKEFFEIVEAGEGKIGWQKTLSSHPDLVVSDVSMPLMDGIELCRRIKADTRTRHIPVILLTALASEEHQLKGLETGATDYMVKPFSFEIMLSRVRNILSQQSSLKKTLSRQVDIKNPEIKVESPDEKFIMQVMTVVEKNLSNAGFSVEELSREMCMSRVSVYKRLFALSGKTPVEFIRSVRLNRAAQLLEKTQMNVAEVAYEVGFNNPKYFARYFKAAFGVLPSVYASGKRKENLAEKANESTAI
ncbi:hybrid sensor histidine kinase/response regulator transcription factor [Foetidibacter luteolus]|uniref:hybrid sensor histidine kinase/response regulator transcription factor n=1 Tax=Foetidibacter luteolus TaxID=2608880 RepID=UPI00129B08BF|nr:two-component regulator propeller domain-containing protein [Foetidibacter luteolus]